MSRQDGLSANIYWFYWGWPAGYERCDPYADPYCQSYSNLLNFHQQSQATRLTTKQICSFMAANKDNNPLFLA